MIPTSRLVPAFMVVLSFVAVGCGCGPSPTSPVGSAARAASERADLALDPTSERDTSPTAPGPDNTAPSVRITNPVPNPLFAPTVVPDVEFRWHGEDADGPGPGVKSYRYRLFAEDDPEFPFNVILTDPDSLLRFYAPNFEGWTEVSGKVGSTRIPGLVPDERYILAITAFDRRKDHDPVFSFSKNLLYFRVGFASPADMGDGGATGGADTTRSTVRR